MKLLSIVKSKYTHAIVFASSVISGSAFAETTSKTPDLSSLTDSIDLSGVLTAIMAIAASLVTLYAGYVGVRWVLRMVKGA